jgi:ferredoxin
MVFTDFNKKKMNELITIRVQNDQEPVRTIEIPTGIDLNLMEVLKASDYDIEATCGGMALCATCHIHVLEGLEQLPPAQDAELDMLDTLPAIQTESRLACQIKIGSPIDGILIRIPTAD